jgi:hypothetical protein
MNYQTVKLIHDSIISNNDGTITCTIVTGIIGVEE